MRGRRSPEPERWQRTSVSIAPAKLQRLRSSPEGPRSVVLPDGYDPSLPD